MGDKGGKKDKDKVKSRKPTKEEKRQKEIAKTLSSIGSGGLRLSEAHNS